MCRYSKPVVLKKTRLRHRVAIEYSSARHVALFEAHSLAVFQIDGGKEDHGFHFKKFAIRARPSRWTLLGMELRADDVVARHDRGDRAAVIGFRHKIGAIRHFELVGMDEIGVQALRPERQAVEQRMRPIDVERVPAHMRNFQVRITGRDAIDLAGDPAQPRGDLVFAAALGQ